MNDARASQTHRTQPHVIIVGGGFGGLAAARALKKAPVRVTLLDRMNHHLFQPLLYQGATAELAPSEIASPIRQVLRTQRNATVGLLDVTRVDADARQVCFSYLDGAERSLPVAACKRCDVGLQTAALLGPRSLRIRRSQGSQSLHMGQQSLPTACKQRTRPTGMANSALRDFLSTKKAMMAFR